MSAEKLTAQLKEYYKQLDLDMLGIASASNELFLKAPKEHQPQEILEGAKSVIVTGKANPRAIFKVKYHHNNIVHRLYHSTYKFLDIAATRIACFLESLGHYSIPIPSYIPLTFRNLEPWGFISLKHAAVAAGLGHIAKNGLFIHPKYGTLIRLSAVITTADLIPNPPFTEEVCKDCNLCITNCPEKAFDKDGKFLKFPCLRTVVKHGLNVFHNYNKEYVKNLELVTNTMFTEYSLGCTKCLEVCPVNNAPLNRST